MSEVRLVVRDARREIQADRHGSFAEAVVAALSAEPETIEELEAGMERFMARSGRGFFQGFGEFVEDRPHDAGLVIVDLPGRLIVWDSNYAAVAPMGEVAYHDGREATDVFVRYHLSEDWMITGDAEGWRAEADERRHRRSQSPPFDGRAVLYGEPLLRFVAAECYDAFRDAGAAAPEEWEDPVYRQEYERVREIHIRRLMTPRDDLRGETPRQVLLARRAFIADDLQDRESQWSSLGICPRGLDPESAACRLGGIGTHEAVVYYDLVRALLWHGRNDVPGRFSRPGGEAPTREQFVAGEVGRLAAFRERWLDSPYSEWGEETPRTIIRNERARIPAAGTGQDAMVDCDCPICQVQAEMPGPVFWHLDGSHMDDDFAFSLWHEAEEEWEAEQAGNEILSDIGRPVSHIVSNLSGYDKLKEDIQAVLDTLVPRETDVQTAEGRWYAMRIQPYRTMDNVIEGAVLTFVDVTQTRKLQEKLQKAGDGHPMAAVLRDASDAVTVQDLDGRIIAWNQGAVRMYGWSEAEALTMNVRDRIPQSLRKDALAELIELSRAKNLVPLSTQRITKQGTVVQVSIVATALLDATGRIYAIATTERLSAPNESERSDVSDVYGQADSQRKARS